MNIIDVKTKNENGYLFYIVKTDSVFYPILQRSICRKWFVPSTIDGQQYEILNKEFTSEMEEAFARFTESRFEEYR